jgi:hypothetical protein
MISILELISIQRKTLSNGKGENDLWSFWKMESPTQQPHLKHVLVLVASSLNYFVSFFSSFNFDTKALLKIIIQQFLEPVKLESPN